MSKGIYKYRYIICLILLALLCLVYIKLPAIQYGIAQQQEQKGEYYQAIQSYSQLKDYKDAKERKIYLIKQANQRQIDTSISNTVKRNEDGNVTLLRNRDKEFSVDAWRDIIAVASTGINIAGLKADGSVVVGGNNDYGQSSSEQLKDIIALDINAGTMVALNEYGKIFVLGKNQDKFQKLVDEWQNVISVAISDNHIVGLTSEGQVLACGDNSRGQCETEEWKDIVQISAAGCYTAALSENGTVYIAGSAGVDAGMFSATIPIDTTSWKDIIRIDAADYHCIGLKKNGTVVAVGNNENKECKVSAWENVNEIAAGIFDTVGLKKDGTYFSTYENLTQVGQ